MEGGSRSWLKETIVNLVFETYIAACSVFHRFAGSGLKVFNYSVQEPAVVQMRSGGRSSHTLLTLGCPGFF